MNTLSSAKIFKVLGFVAAAGGIGIVSAPGSASADGPPAPPEQAFTACQSKSEGDACSVTFHDREIQGTCATHPSDKRLACRPSGPPSPPPEAYDACSGKKVADSCTVQFGQRSLTGTCTQGSDSRIFCAPPRPEGGPPQR